MHGPLGSSSAKHKVLGFYYAAINKWKALSQRSLIQTVALISPADVKEFGLSICLKEIILELQSIVENGIFDEQSGTKLEVRIICSLGTVPLSYSRRFENLNKYEVIKHNHN